MAILTVTSQNFDAIVKANEIVVLDFWASWCQPCHSFSKIFSEVAEKNIDIAFGKINTEEETELALEFNVRSIPLVMLLRRKIVLFAESGLLPASALQDIIEQAKALNIEKILQELQH